MPPSMGGFFHLRFFRTWYSRHPKVSPSSPSAIICLYRENHKLTWCFTQLYPTARPDWFSSSDLYMKALTMLLPVASPGLFWMVLTRCCSFFCLPLSCCGQLTEVSLLWWAFLFLWRWRQPRMNQVLLIKLWGLWFPSDTCLLLLLTFLFWTYLIPSTVPAGKTSSLRLALLWFSPEF